MADEVNLGGRPPIYESTQESFDKVEELCKSFFEYIKGEYHTEEQEYEKGKFKDVTITDRNPQPPTVTGLALHLGFESKDTLYSYAKKDGFSYSIKKALTLIEQYHEIQVAYGDKCTGNIFVLKNFNWKDSQAVEHSGNVSNLPPQITFVDADDEVQ